MQSVLRVAFHTPSLILSLCIYNISCILKGRPFSATFVRFSESLPLLPHWCPVSALVVGGGYGVYLEIRPQSVLFCKPQHSVVHQEKQQHVV